MYLFGWFEHHHIYTHLYWTDSWHGTDIFTFINVPAGMCLYGEYLICGLCTKD